MVARYRELMPTANVTLLEGIGHYPQVEAPQAVPEPIALGQIATPSRTSLHFRCWLMDEAGLILNDNCRNQPCGRQQTE